MKKIVLVTLMSLPLGLILLTCKSDSDPEIVASLDSLFNHSYSALKTFSDDNGTIPRVNNQPVLFWEDLSGDQDLLYIGDRNPTRYGQPPSFFDTDGGYVFIPNVQFQQWSTKLPSVTAQPIEIYLVIRDLNAPQNEGYLGSFRAPSFRDKADHLRMSIQADDGDFQPGTPVLTHNKITIMKLRYDGANSMAWMNGERIPGTVNVGNKGVENLVIGTANNNAHCDIFFMGVKFGSLTSAEDNFIYEELSKLYPPNTYPNKPLADDIKATWNNTDKSWSADYTYVSTEGIAEDTNATEYMWLTGGNGPIYDLQNQIIIAGANSKVLKRSDYPSVFSGTPSGVWFKAIVKVHDANGNSWRFLDSDWAVDNIP
ncbi:MAG: hypothetical protein RH948_03020 [Cyclobacteriaceae bacterium]